MKTLAQLIPDCIGNWWQMVNRSHACRRKTQCVIKKASRCPCCDHSTGFKRHTIRAERRWSKQVIREQLKSLTDDTSWIDEWNNYINLCDDLRIQKANAISELEKWHKKSIREINMRYSLLLSEDNTFLEERNLQDLDDLDYEYSARLLEITYKYRNPNAP